MHAKPHQLTQTHAGFIAACESVGVNPPKSLTEPITCAKAIAKHFAGETIDALMTRHLEAGTDFRDDPGLLAAIALAHAPNLEEVAAEAITSALTIGAPAASAAWLPALRARCDELTEAYDALAELTEDAPCLDADFNALALQPALLSAHSRALTAATAVDELAALTVVAVDPLSVDAWLAMSVHTGAMSGIPQRLAEHALAELDTATAHKIAESASTSTPSPSWALLRAGIALDPTDAEGVAARIAGDAVAA